jgi:hypothetical protein
VSYGKQKIQEHETAESERNSGKEAKQSPAHFPCRVFHPVNPFDAPFIDSILANLCRFEFVA